MHPYLRNKRRQKCSQETRKVDRKEKQWSVTTVKERRMFPEGKNKNSLQLAERVENSNEAPSEGEDNELREKGSIEW